MLRKDSRYAKGRLFEGTDSFPGLRPREITTLEGVVEHRVKEGDRLDLLARHYYNNDRLWTRILDANPELLCGGDAVLGHEWVRTPPDLALIDMVGRTILIPRSS